jgi:hypothetical protein
MNNRRHIPGIDEPLPEGEHLLWSGSPSIGVHLRRSPLLPVAGAWLLIAAVLPLVLGSGGPGPTAAHLAWVGVITLVLLTTGWGFAWLVARTTSYAVTDRRIVLRIGIALPAVLNLPIDSLQGAEARVNADGSGDIYLSLAPVGEQPGYALLWPHARPWRWGRPEPAIRWLDDVDTASQALREAALQRKGAVPEAPEARRTVERVGTDFGSPALSGSRGSA